MCLSDCVHLCLHKGRQPHSSRPGPPSDVFALEDFCGIDAPFQYDHEQHVMAVVCRQHVVVLALADKSTLDAWCLAIRCHLGCGGFICCLLYVLINTFSTLSLLVDWGGGHSACKYPAADIQRMKIIINNNNKQNNHFMTIIYSLTCVSRHSLLLRTGGIVRAAFCCLHMPLLIATSAFRLWIRRSRVLNSLTNTVSIA